MLEAINDAAKTRSDRGNFNLVAPQPAKSREPVDDRSPAQQKLKGNETSDKTTEVSQAMLDTLQEKMSSIHQVGLRFSKHEETGRTVIRVVNKDTDELIREIPPENVLNLAARLNDMMGILFNEVV